MEFKDFVENKVVYHHDERDLDNLLQQCTYLKRGAGDIIAAYYFARKAHEGAFREGGEPYLIHPFTVAMYAAFHGLSKEGIVASLLHDVVEDTPTTLAEIEACFGKSVAAKVDGLSKFDMMFTSKEEKVACNTSKLFRAFSRFDPEVILIKLLDRTHNMTTIHQKKRREKQEENAKETLNVFVPIARHLGCNGVRRVLEEKSFQCLHKEAYQEISLLRSEVAKRSALENEKMKEIVLKKLQEKGIDGQLEVCIKESYGIFRKRQAGFSDDKIHDLLSMRVVVDTKADCYSALASIHEVIHPEQYRMKDYIAAPKANGYQSFHTTGHTASGKQYQFRIRTKEMADRAERGICVFANREDITMQEVLMRDYQFYKDLIRIDALYPNDVDFYQALKGQILESNIYVSLSDGEKVELPRNATVLDLVCKLGTNYLLHYSSVALNGESMPIGTTLKEDDTVDILLKENETIPSKWMMDCCHTPLAKGMIDSLQAPKVKTLGKYLQRF